MSTAAKPPVKFQCDHEILPHLTARELCETYKMLQFYRILKLVINSRFWQIYCIRNGKMFVQMNWSSRSANQSIKRWNRKDVTATWLYIDDLIVTTFKTSGDCKAVIVTAFRFRESIVLMIVVVKRNGGFKHLRRSLFRRHVIIWEAILLRFSSHIATLPSLISEDHIRSHAWTNTTEANPI